MKKKNIVILALLFGVLLAAIYSPAKVDYRNQSRSLEQGDAIAVIHVDGVLSVASGRDELFGEGGGTDAVIKKLHQAAGDDEIKAIVMRINSPGGSTAATEEIGREMRKIRDQGKIIVVSMGDVAASGGYWLAACADKIYANPTTMTGSIGVYMPYANFEELYRKIGVRQEKIKSGAHKDILSSDRPMTEEERAIVQAMVDEVYEGFVGIVAEGRHMEPERVREIADGRIYTGRQAQELGLVDELGNMYDAIDGAAMMAGINGKPQIKELKDSNNWREFFNIAAKAGQLFDTFESINQIYQLMPARPLLMPEKW